MEMIIIEICHRQGFSTPGRHMTERTLNIIYAFVANFILYKPDKHNRVVRNACN